MRHHPGASAIWLLTTGLLLIGGCPDTPPVQPDNGTLSETEEATAKGQSAFQRLRELSDSFGEDTAKQMLADELIFDPDVFETEITEQGIWLEMMSGPDVMLLLDPLAGAADSVNPLAKSNAAREIDPAKEMIRAAAGDIKPRFDKGIAIVPTASEYPTYTTNMLKAADAGFLAIGAPKIERVLNQSCTLDKYRRLDGYGVIYLGGHSVWKKSASEAYIVTAETLESPEDHIRIRSAYQKYIDSKDLKLCMTEPIGGGAEVWHLVVSPRFVTDGLDLNDEKSLVWLGFCWGGLGSWRDKFRSAGASVVLGWDDTVLAVADLALARNMFEEMCDTSLSQPMTIDLWHALGKTSYVDPKEGTTVTLDMRGNRGHTLWERKDVADAGGCTSAEVVVTSGVALTIEVDATRLDADGSSYMFIYSEAGEESMFLPPGRWRLTAEVLPGQSPFYEWETEIDLTCTGYHWRLNPP